MNEQVASMIARSESTHRQTSHTPILDFDRRGHVYTPGWFEQGLINLRRSMMTLIASLKNRKPYAPAMTHETPVSENY